ncbi:FAD-binding oxidoreductase [Corynebacterium lubricantis]|uniref:FAD-binding oxidoreductase n=1 Tax=Corynebacterium lubricantis TaxID=541095 RepID=UPI000380DFF4|nr:FAD-binding oxidoreductase [Corynebacterium lubricantis]
MGEHTAESLAELFLPAVGPEGVKTSAADIKEFSDPYTSKEAPGERPIIIVQPETVEEVQAVVRIAGEHGIYLSANSTGRNYGYGGGAPVVDQTVVVNLRRMNKVIEINEKAAYAEVEPGVSFFDLYNAIQDGGYKLSMSVPDLGWGSVTGNALEHGMGYSVYGDHASAICGMEVVLADGTLVRTGLGAIPDSEMWHRHKRGFGPSVDSLFMQSNFGIVTKVGVWLMPQPESVTTGSVICDNDENIATVLDALQPLVASGVIQGQPLMTCAPQPPEGERATPETKTDGKSKLYKLSASLPPGRFNARIAFYGTPELNEVKERQLRETVKDIEGVTVELRTYAGDAKAEDVHPLDLVPMGIPNMFLLDVLKAHFGESFGHIDFSPVMPFDGKPAAEFEAYAQKVLREEDLVAAFGWIGSPRSIAAVNMVFFDTNDADERARAVRAVKKMGQYAVERGWSEYRAHPHIIDEVVSSYTFNDGALHNLYTTLKDALDPKGILAPGSHGIWGTSQKHLHA